MIEHRCRIDGQPTVRVGDTRKCLNEQETHEYVWPDPDKNTGWMLVEKCLAEA